MESQSEDSEDRVLGLIPARGGSKGIIGKNIAEVGGKPLVAYSIEAGQKAAAVDRVLVSTDDDDIRETAEAHGGDVLDRPARLATDTAPTAPVVTHALNATEQSYDTVLLLQPTSPLRTAEDIDGALARYDESDAYSVVSVTPDHSYRWERRDDHAVQVNYEGNRGLRRQDKTPELRENGAIYAADVARFRETELLTAGRTAVYELPRERAVDVDEPVDLAIVEAILDRGLIERE